MSTKKQARVSKIINPKKLTSPPSSRKSKRAPMVARKSERKSFKTNQLTTTYFSTLSSSARASTASSSQLNLSEDDDNESEIPDILEVLFDTDNESLQEEEPAYIQRRSLESTTDFFEEFGSIPEIYDLIQEDHTITAEQVIQKNESANEDVGRFVDPLTGDVLHSSESKSTSDLVALNLTSKFVDNQHTFAKSVIFAEDVTEVYEIDLEMDLPEYTFDDDVEVSKVVDAEEAFENFLEMESNKETSTVVDTNGIAARKEEEAKHLHQYAVDIVNDLISKAVEIAEFISPADKLRQHLDKRKLILELLEKTQEFEVENRIRLFLNQKIVEFYRRKKCLRPIKPDSMKTVQLEMREYSHAVERLDHMLAEESNVIATTLKKKQELENDLKETKTRSQAEIQYFEDIVKKNLMRDNRPKSNVLVENLLADMSKCRQEVSAVRFEMLTKQHTEATLMEKLAKIDDLGNGLTMNNFDNLQTETQTLGKKVEERNLELSKLYRRVRRDIHLMAHYKEKQKMLRNSIVAQRMAFDELMDEKQAWRARIRQLTMERNRIRQQIKELSFKGGLLDKPALMLDYDRTCEMVKEHRDVICVMRDKLQRLQAKIDGITKHC